MRRKVLAWTLFLGSLLLLNLAATPYSRAADAALIFLRLTLLIVLSILVVRERWRNRHELPGRVAVCGVRFSLPCDFSALVACPDSVGASLRCLYSCFYSCFNSCFILSSPNSRVCAKIEVPAMLQGAATT